MKRVSLISLFLLLNLSVFAQSEQRLNYHDRGCIRYSVSGIIQDSETKLPVEFSTAILFKAENNAQFVVDTFRCDQTGRFEFSVKPDLSYIILARGNSADEYWTSSILIDSISWENTWIQRDIYLKMID